MGLEAEDTDLTGEFTYWSAFTGDSQVWDQSRVDAFNELYKDKGIKCNVQFVPDGAGINNGKLLSAIAGGQAPDLVICDNATAAYSYAANGSFEMLEPYLEQVNLNVDNFFDGCQDVIYYKDEPYLIPQDTNVMLLYYNPDIAKEAGLDPENPPKTLDELDQWAEAMTIQNDDGSYARFGLIPWLDLKDDAFTLPFFFGADVYDADTNKLNLTAPQMVSCMEWPVSYTHLFRKCGVQWQRHFLLTGERAEGFKEGYPDGIPGPLFFPGPQKNSGEDHCGASCGTQAGAGQEEKG